MASIPLVALDSKTQGPSPLQTYEQAQAVLGQRTENQVRQLQVQQAQLSLQDQQAQTKAMQQWDGKDYNDIPSLIRKNGGSLNAVLDATQKVVARQQQMQTLDETSLKNAQTRGDQNRGRVQSIIDADPSQQNALWDAEITKEEQAGTIKPGAVSHQYPGDDVATYWANHFALGSTLAKEAIDAKQASARQTSATAAAGELDLRTKEWQAKTDPNSPQYDPSAAFLAKQAAAGNPEAQTILAQQTKQAGAKAGAEAAAKFPYELQLKQQELAQNPVFAVNPKTNQRELTTVADAKAQGFSNPIKASQGDVEKAGEFNAQANDVQMNASRYKAALNAVQTPFSKTEVANVTQILSDPNVQNHLTNLLGMPSLMNMIEQGDRAKDWNALSPDKQQALIGYLRMKGAAIAYQKMLTNQGRTSKEGLDIELANIPSPILGATVGNKQLQAFQENIDTAAQRSVKLPWMEQPQDVRARIEGQATQEYNQTQANKPQGKYRMNPGSNLQPGQNVQIRNVPGLSRVKKVYPDGTFDADQNP